MLQNMGSAGFEPANSSARGWHHTMLDNDPSKHGNMNSLGFGIYLLAGSSYLAS